MGNKNVVVCWIFPNPHSIHCREILFQVIPFDSYINSVKFVVEKNARAVKSSNDGWPVTIELQGKVVDHDLNHGQEKLQRNKENDTQEKTNVLLKLCRLVPSKCIDIFLKVHRLLGSFDIKFSIRHASQLLFKKEWIYFPHKLHWWANQWRNAQKER